MLPATTLRQPGGRSSSPGGSNLSSSSLGTRGLRIAVVHDWLYIMGGAERVLRSILRCVPSADVFALFDILSEEDRARIGFAAARTSFLQRMPGIARRHRLYLPLMPLAIEQFDLSGYDLIISSSYAVAKGVLTGPDQLHLAYVHSPMRYAWDLQHQYLAEARLTTGVKSLLTRMMLHRMRIWDARTAHGVDAYMANSHFISRRIAKAYGRNARVIYPPVKMPAAAPRPHTWDDQSRDDRSPEDHSRQNYFLAASRLVSYKNIRAIVDAFAGLPDQRLLVAGSGPEFARLAAAATPNVSLLGFVPDAELRRLMRTARAFVFAAEEDFGITPLEAQSEGTPVIALGRGGVRETIITEGPAPTGLFFDEPSPAAISAAVRSFLARAGDFTAASCHANALRFAESRFESEFTAFVDEQFAAFQARLAAGCGPAEPVRVPSLATVG